MEVVLKVSSDPEWETTLCNTFKASAVCRCNALAFSTCGKLHFGAMSSKHLLRHCLTLSYIRV